MLRYKKSYFPRTSNFNPNVSSFIPESFNPQSNISTTKIKSLSRDKHHRKKTKQDEFMGNFNDRKIFFESILRDDIMDRQDLLEELEKEKTRNENKMKEFKSGGAVVLGTVALAAKAIPLAKTAIHTIASDHLYNMYKERKTKSKKKKSGKKGKKKSKKKGGKKSKKKSKKTN